MSLMLSLKMVLGGNSQKMDFRVGRRLKYHLERKAEEEGTTVSELIRLALYDKYLSDLIDEARADWKTLKREWKKKKKKK